MARLTRWHVAPFQNETAARVSADLGISVLTASLLVNRGYDNAGAASAFLAPDLAQLHDPLLMPGMDRAVARLKRAIDSQERILIYGDYDVDGVTSTAMLLRALRAMNANVGWHIPHRVLDGYGVNADAIRQAASEGASVVLTVDCGISASAQVALATSLGMDVIISDHHEPPADLPDALAVLNPKLAESPYPFKELAGVGVAFKLLTALVRETMPEHERNLQRAFLDFVALGTIADVAPLVNENRVFAKLGLEQLRQTRSVGLRALKQVAGIGDRLLTSHDVGFGLGPRLNAGGRLDTAERALQLLVTKDNEEAFRLAKELEIINRARQDEEAMIVDEARGRVSFDYDLNERAIVLASENWHVGVVGIAASRLVESFHRPTILLAIDGEQAKGSGRSISAFHLYEALCECKDLLTRFGGHQQAAGMSLRAADVELFRRRFTEVARSRLSADGLVPTIHIDAEIGAGELTEQLLTELDRLAPFGMGNPRPQFVLRGAGIVNIATVSDGKHLKMRIKAGDRYFDAIWWREGNRAPELEKLARADICFTPEFNEYNGIRTIQLNVKDVKAI